MITINNSEYPTLLVKTDGKYSWICVDVKYLGMPAHASFDTKEEAIEHAKNSPNHYGIISWTGETV